MLSRTGEYALRAVLLLARRGTGRATPADVIADELDVPRNYLSKTLNRLVRRGVLVSGRGPHGGFRLARRAEDLPVADVVAEFEDRGAEGKCPMGGRTCDPERPCAAHDQWQAWSSQRSRWLDGTTVADLLRGGERSAPASASRE
jgi:Rrf2 family protein